MARHCLIINDDSIIEKLEYFIYDYSSVKYNDINIILNHFTCSNINDMKSLKDIDNYELRKILLFNSHPFNNIDRTTVEKAIDLFLLFLRTYNMEASINLNKLIELIWVTGNEGHQWECIKRITGILSAIYSLYFADKAIIFDKSMTEQEMIRICYNNSRFYTKEDKNFLLHIFLNERKYDYLLEILLLDLEFVQHTESITLESQKKIVNSYIRFLKNIKNRKDYDDELLFLEKSERILNLISDETLSKFFNDYLKTEQAKNLFNLKRFEEAKNIQIDYINNKSGQAKNVYEIYNCAIYYAWAADRKERDDPERKEYLKKAYDMISKAEEYVNQNNLPNEKFKNELLDKEFINGILFEKSFLLSEFNDYTNAFEYFFRAYSNSIKHTTSNSRQYAAILDSDFNTHFWILMKYMCLNRDEYKTVKSIIEELYSKFGHKVPKEYSAILNFMHTNEYLNAKRDEEIYDSIYINLLMLMFRSLEIKHETKICDVSKYDILYYTKIEHLRLLLEDEAKQNCHYRLPMFHVYHMNDPQEGRLIQNLLQKDKFIVFDDSPIQNSRTFSEENFIFLKSFFAIEKMIKII